MAQKVNIILVDDLDGSEANQTVAFGLDGSDYEIDLTDKHAEELREALAAYVGHARKVGRGRARSTSKPAPSSSSSVDKSAVREWAKENGMEVSERGRIPAPVQEAYDAAQAKGGTKRGGTAKRTASIEQIEKSKAS